MSKRLLFLRTLTAVDQHGRRQSWTCGTGRFSSCAVGFPGFSLKNTNGCDNSYEGVLGTPQHQRLAFSTRKPGRETGAKPSKGTVGEEEEVYSRKTPLEHVLLRPGMYIGPNHKLSRSPYWVLEKPPPAPSKNLRTMTMTDLPVPETQLESNIVKRECEIVPALVKVLDEILVNAYDNRLRDSSLSKRIDVVIDRGTKEQEPLIRVFNDGKGISVTMHKKEKIYNPELIFGHLLTGSNFDDSIKRVTGGRHGYGAKLSNIFSKSFTIEVADSGSKKLYIQTWTENMTKVGKADITPYTAGKDYTCVSFVPDLERLTGVKGAYQIEDDEYAMMCRRVVDIAGCAAGKLSVSLNGFDVSASSFNTYLDLYRTDSSIGTLVCDAISPQWSVAVGLSNTGTFESVSFVNGISTDRGGTHVDVITKQIMKHIQDEIGKTYERKDRLLSKPILSALIKRHLFVGINCLIENPAFDSQTKEHLNTTPADFGSSYTLPNNFLAALTKPKDSGGPGILEKILDAIEVQQDKKLMKAISQQTSKPDLPSGLEDAHKAGSSKGWQCTLILTEGNSAKALAVAGLEIVGREKYGVLPLKGKLLNVRHASKKQLSDNAEVTGLCKVMGLDFRKTYETVEERRSLRYGRVMLTADMDTDGSHIKGLVINLFRFFWPALLRPPVDAPGDPPFLSTFVTPLLKAKGKGQKPVPFYSSADFNKWKAGVDLSKWKIKYYKGLGTSTAEEAKEYFSDLKKHVRNLEFKFGSDSDILDMVFDKERANDRRNWINDVYDAESSLYSEKDNDSASIFYEDFVNKELIHFSHCDNIRSIPSAIDGLKPSQRKVLYSCFKRKLNEEMKVAQLSGYVAETSAYHHGEVTLQKTIVKMAQDFLGSNNINLLVPSGQFGTRSKGGEDAASPRYIFTFLSPITRALFPEEDDALLTYLEDDGQIVEPKYYCPVIPMLLVNGAKGIGTGWSTSVPHYNPNDIVKYIRAKLDGKDELPAINPFVRGFTGTLEKVSAGYTSSGRARKTSAHSVVIEELPLGCWTETYKKDVLEKLDISGFVENHTPTKVSFGLRLSRVQMKQMEKVGFEKSLKLTAIHSTNNMHAFDENGNLVHFKYPEEVIEAFFPVRLKLYNDRLSVMQSEIKYAALFLRNKARFIQYVLSGKINLMKNGGVEKSEILTKLTELEFHSTSALEDVRSDNVVGRQKKTQKISEDDSRFDYLLNMPLSSLTYERIVNLEAEVQKKQCELDEIQKKTAEELWSEDLDRLESFWPKQ